MKSRRIRSMKRKHTNNRKTKIRGGSSIVIPTDKLTTYEFRKIQGRPKHDNFYFYKDKYGEYKQVEMEFVTEYDQRPVRGGIQEAGTSYTYRPIIGYEIKYDDTESKFIKSDQPPMDWYEAVIPSE